MAHAGCADDWGAGFVSSGVAGELLPDKQHGGKNHDHDPDHLKWLGLGKIDLSDATGLLSGIISARLSVTTKET